MGIEPPNAKEVQSVVEKRLASALVGLEESVTIEWRDAKRAIPVISMPVDLVYYNPNTRRIQAQRGIDSARQEELEESPFSEVSQAYLEELLQWDPASPGKVDPAFDKLKDDLDEHGQDEPGLMTRSGVLINGNTRRAALRRLGKEHIRVGVLPDDASRADIDALELSLQLRRTFKRDYSFVNELLAISAEVKKGTPTPHILRAFRMKQDRFERSMWLLDFIDEAIRRSTSSGTDGGVVALRRFDFERDKGQLEELYRSWSNLNKTDSVKAAVLRETRLIGVVLGFAKTDLRVMDEDFFERFVEPKLPSNLLTPPEVDLPKGVPGLPEVKLPATPRDLQQVRKLGNSVLMAEAKQKNASIATPLGEAESALLADIRVIFNEARTKAGASAELRRKGTGPADRIIEASDALDSAAEALNSARAANTLDVGALEDALEELRESLTRLSQLLSRVDEEKKDVGFAWIQAAVNVELIDEH